MVLTGLNTMNGNVVQDVSEVEAKWREHFRKLLDARKTEIEIRRMKTII